MKTNKQEVVQELLAEMSKQVYLKDGTRFIAEKQVIQALQTAYEAGRKEAIKECEGCETKARLELLNNLKSIADNEPDPTAIAPKMRRYVEQTLQTISKMYE